MTSGSKSGEDPRRSDTGEATRVVEGSGDPAERSRQWLESDVLPTTVGRYRIAERLGAGGFAVVHAAYDPDLDRRVAIKLVRPTDANDPEMGPRLLREARALAQLTHPNVVVVFDVGKWEHGVFIAMQLVDGENAATWRNRKPRTWREVVELYSRAGLGLAAAHSAELVHRDFKPANVLIGADGTVRVADFGLAIPVDTARRGSDSRGHPNDDAPPDSSRVTRDGVVVGTPRYMAPEQTRTGTASAASDQFSFCVSLFEAAVGRHPFGDEPTALAERIEREDLEPIPNELGIPAWLGDAMRRGLRARPEDRWPSMLALLDQLATHRAVARQRGLHTGNLSAYVRGVLEPVLGPHMSRHAVTIVAKKIGKPAEALAIEDLDAIRENLMPMLRTIAGAAVAHRVAESLVPGVYR